uniref:Thymocyte selection-associated high mobility group box n=1 Tax=Poecilia formosa TaxID=48698 RepID=A0A087XFJ3_POEFO
SYSMNGFSDEDFNIPPITPPTLPDHTSAVHVENIVTQRFEGCLPLSHAGVLPSPPQPSGLLKGTVINTHLLQTTAIKTNKWLMQQMVNSDSRFASSQQPIKAALGPRSQSGLSQQNQLSTINQSQLGMNGNPVPHNSPSPPGSKSTTPSPPSSAHEDDNDDGLKLNNGEKRPAAVDISKKPKTPKKKKRKDPNEPVKPVSAYALFFRDTQANIKAQNPNATFGEVSKIVASMWDGLGEEQKQVYKKRTETAKKEYLKQLAAYRASLVSQSYSDPSEMKAPHSASNSSPSPTSMFTPKPSVYPGHPGPHASPSSISSHPHSLPGLGPHIPPPHHQIHPQLQALSSRGTVPRASVPHQGALSLGNVAAASTPPLQVSQAHLGGLHSPHHQHQHLGGHSLGMTHSPAITQGYHPSLQSDYQSMGGAMLNSGAVMSPSVDYHQLGRHTPNHHPSLDWSTEYHGNGSLQRDKPLYLS